MKRQFLLFMLLSMFFAFLSSSCYAGTYYFTAAQDGKTGSGTRDDPWRVNDRSQWIQKVPDQPDVEVRFLSGDYSYYGALRFSRAFNNWITFVSDEPYKAILKSLYMYGGNHIIIDGFNVDGGGVVVGPIFQVGSASKNIIIRNNIIHDSAENDVLKINDKLENIKVTGNVIYNQVGNDELIDANAIIDTEISGNIFFTDFTASGRTPEYINSLIVIKNSPLQWGTETRDYSRNILVADNIFLWGDGTTDNGAFVMLGEDGVLPFEATDIYIRNNLMLGGSQKQIGAAFSIMGIDHVEITNNTVSGYLNARRAYIMRLINSGSQITRRMYLRDNVFSDPTGQMQSISGQGGQTCQDCVLEHNLYWNGGKSLPSNVNDGGGPFHPIQGKAPVYDSRAIFTNPLLPNPSGVMTAWWNKNTNRFKSGNRYISEEYQRLAQYGIPQSGSPLVNENIGFKTIATPTEKCNDGTLYSQCSPTKPRYCENGQLLNKCNICGCNVNEVCQQDGSCIITSDTTAPVRSNPQPTGSLVAGTTSTNIRLTTDEVATCKYSTTANIAYASMTNTFSNSSGGMSHSASVTGLQNGRNYNYYVRCKDAAGNVNTNDFTITFSVLSSSELIITNINPTNYIIDYLKEGDTYYIDRAFTILSLPTTYQNLLWIKTGNNDKYTTNLGFRFDTNQDITLYIGYDSRVSAPSWLVNNYINTGEQIRVDEKEYGYLNLNVWKREVTSGTIQLGDNTGLSMYVVLIASYHEADINKDNKIEMNELINFISKWKSGNAALNSLMTALDRWFKGG